MRAIDVALGSAPTDRKVSFGVKNRLYTRASVSSSLMLDAGGDVTYTHITRRGSMLLVARPPAPVATNVPLSASAPAGVVGPERDLPAHDRLSGAVHEDDARGDRRRAVDRGGRADADRRDVGPGHREREGHPDGARVDSLLARHLPARRCTPTALSPSRSRHAQKSPSSRRARPRTSHHGCLPASPSAARGRRRRTGCCWHRSSA